MKTVKNTLLLALLSAQCSQAMAPSAEQERAQRRTLAASAALVRLQGTQHNPAPVAQPTSSRSEETAEAVTCAICLEESQQNNPLKQTICEHTFHVPCLTQARERKNECPICRMTPALFIGIEAQTYFRSQQQANRPTPRQQIATPQAPAPISPAPQAIAAAPAGVSIRDLLAQGETFHINRTPSAHCNEVRLTISNPTLTSLDGLQNIPGIQDVQVLFINRTCLSRVRADSFNGLPKLATLSLADNQIELIEDNAFRGLRSLKTLYLCENQISAWSGQILSGLDNLELLGLSKNRIRRFPYGAFEESPQLDNLSLGDNPIEAFEAGAFNNLANLEALFLMGTNLNHEELKEIQRRISEVSNVRCILSIEGIARRRYE